MNASEFVTLNGQLTAPLAALQFALDLEARGCRLLLDGDGLLIGPRERVTDEDRAAIRRWREYLKAIASYRAPEVLV